MAVVLLNIPQERYLQKQSRPIGFMSPVSKADSFAQDLRPEPAPGGAPRLDGLVAGPNCEIERMFERELGV